LEQVHALSTRESSSVAALIQALARHSFSGTVNSALIIFRSADFLGKKRAVKLLMRFQRLWVAKTVNEATFSRGFQTAADAW
jgi:hypothetical protein